jgi:glycosyltransferase involved in cell wall biosynthesis
VYFGDMDEDAGPSVVVRNLVNEWSKSNTITIIGNNKNLSMRNVDLKLIGAANLPLWWLRTPSFHRHLVNQDVIVDASDNPALGVESRLLGVPLCLQEHGNGYLSSALRSDSMPYRWIDFAVELTSIKLADYIITVSEAARRNLSSFYGREGGIHVIRNGVATQVFEKTGDTKRDYILFVGDSSRHFVRKGIDCLMKAFSTLAKRSKRFSLVFAGTTDARVGQLSRGYGIESQVKLLGRVQRSELIKLYNEARLLVLPSVFDTYGLVVNEALSCGTPVIVSDGVGASEIVEESEAGLVFPVNNSDALFDCLQRILFREDFANELSVKGIEYCRRNLDWTVVAEKYVELFRRNL